MTEYKKAILAGGCFWGMQDLIRKQPGVVSTRVGYTGGENANATYRNHPGHAEAIEIVYDPAQTDYRALLEVALEEARLGLDEGGVPIGAALFDLTGALLGRGHNRRVQENDPSVHGETDAFRKAGRQRRYQDTIMVTTLAPCWYCSGLIVQFRIGKVVVGESRTFRGGLDWLRERGVDVLDLDSSECVDLLTSFEDGTEPQSPPREARKAVAIIEGILESQASGNNRVDIG